MSHFLSILLTLFSFVWGMPATTSPPGIFDNSGQSSYLARIKAPDFLREKGSDWPKRNWEISFIELQARSALAISLDGSKVYYQKNILEPLPMASITKLMTAVLVLENYSLDEVITISPETVLREGERGNLRRGEKITVRSLLSMMLIQSSNSAAVALAEYWPRRPGFDRDIRNKSKAGDFRDFVETMNKKARSIGLQNTRFVNPDGIDADNHFSSARDVAFLLGYFSSHFPWALDILRTQEAKVYSFDGRIEHRLVSTDELLKKDFSILGGKTGFTDNAQGVLALVVSGFGKENIITVVMASRDRFGETEKLIGWLKKAYNWIQ